MGLALHVPRKLFVVQGPWFSVTSSSNLALEHLVNSFGNNLTCSFTLGYPQHFTNLDFPACCSETPVRDIRS